MKLIRVHFSISEELLQEVDTASKDAFSTRSNFIRESIIMRLKTDQYIEAQLNDKNSDFNAIQTARLINNSKRDLRKYPSTDFC